MNYKFDTAPYDMGILLITTLVFILPLTAITVIIVVIEIVIAQKAMFLPFVGLIWLLIFGVGLLWAPRCYLVLEKTIVIKRLIGDIVIPKSAIRSIEVVERIPSGARAYSGGIFCFYRSYLSFNGDVVTLYCTRMDRVVVIKTDQTDYVVSPFDPEGFCIAVWINESKNQ